MPNINVHIKEFRIFRKIKQEDLASALGKSKNVISNWENGLNRPDVESIENICRILHVTPNQIFGWEPLPEYEEHRRYLLDLNKRKEDLRRQLMFTQHQLCELEKEYDNILNNLEEDDDLTDTPIAAHNDHAAEPGELEKMQEDVKGLKRPED